MMLLAEIDSTAHVPWQVSAIVLSIFAGLALIALASMIAKPHR